MSAGRLPRERPLMDRAVTLVTFVSLRSDPVGPGNFVLALGAKLQDRGRLAAIVCPDYDDGVSPDLDGLVRSPVPRWLWRVARRTLRVLGRLSSRTPRRLEEQLFDLFVSRSPAITKADVILFTKPSFPNSAMRARTIGKSIFGWASILHPEFNLEQATRERQQLDRPWESDYLDVQRTRSLSRFFDQVHVLVNSSFAGRTFLDKGIPRERLSVLTPRTVVDTDRFRPSDAPSDGVFRVLHVSHMSPLKGIRYLLQAWEELAMPNAELVLVGQADRVAASLIERHGEKASVRWVGPSNRPEEWYRGANLFVSPSIADNLPNTVMEAMASGIPALVSDQCGIQEMVSEGADGFVYKYDDLEVLKGRLAWCAANRDRLTEMGAAGRAKICAWPEAALEEELIAEVDRVLESDGGVP